jgi:SAM-dependent methyltransferase
VNIGCGYDGRFREFERAGSIFVNFDIVYDMLYSLRADFGATCCVAGDLNRLPFKKEAFDYVICIDVIHHESDRLSILLESLVSLLKKGGSLFLEDLNSWGMFQFPKSVLLPKPLHRILRSAYHNIRRSSHKPADYEFATSVWSVKKILKRLGFSHIIFHENTAYPNIGPVSFRAYEFLSRFGWFRKYHNYHYMLVATKGRA